MRRVDDAASRYVGHDRAGATICTITHRLRELRGAQ